MRKHIRRQRTIRGTAGAQINIQESVIVDVAEVGSHGHEDLVKPDFGGDVAKTAVSQVPVKLQGCGVMGKSKICSRRLLGGKEITGDEQVGPPVVVVIKEPGGKAARGCLHAGNRGHVGEGVVVIIVVEDIASAKVREKKIGITVVVVIASGNT